MVGRPEGRYYQSILEDVYSFVSKNPGTSINEVSIKCGIGWDTAKRYLKELENNGKIVHRTVGGRINIYYHLITNQADTPLSAEEDET